MRVLCLHGFGTSAHIFKAQTSAFRSKVKDNCITFDFVDAPLPSHPAPGIRAIFETSNFCWWPIGGGPDQIAAAHVWLADYMAQHGPYDAVCGFSQGCSLISSFILYHAQEVANYEVALAEWEEEQKKSQNPASSTSSSTSPEQQPQTTKPTAPPPLPFHGAIFICGSAPYPALDDLGLPIPSRAHELNDLTTRQLTRKAGALIDLAAHPDRIARGAGLWDDTSELIHDPTAALPPREEVFGLDFSQFPAHMQVKMPTVHVYGGKDPKWPQGVQLAYFCPDRRVYDHGGGHDIPRGSEVSDRIAGLVEELKERLERM